MKKVFKKGFTIVELVIVIAVIAILAAVLIPTFSNVVDKANQSSALQECSSEFNVYYAENAENLTGEEDYVIVYSKDNDTYFVEVTNLQLGSVSKVTADNPVPTHQTRDLTKAVKSATVEEDDEIPTASDNSVSGKFYTTKACTVEVTSYEKDAVVYYVSTDEIQDGNKNVAIYAK